MDEEDRLVIDMFNDYNHLIRPVRFVNSSSVVIEFGIAMILLINVDEKNQIMQTNVWLTLKWNDFQLRWDPANYGGIASMRVPQDKVWVPDIVLFNNADGNYEVSFLSNVNVESNGDVTWVPPAIYKSSCRIDVEYFPFDEQTCVLIFGSWTYDSSEVQLSWYNNKEYVELNDYSYSGIWDVMDVPGQLAQNASKVVFHIVIRRKTLFYTVILIIPTVLMAFLSMMVFYLPAECSEKITLSISILLALVVFLLLVSKILPPTSDTIPLMAKYLLMTFVLNIITIMVTVVIVNIYFRSARTHSMPQLLRRLFLHLLPQLLMMKRPERIPIFNGYFVEEYCASEIFDASLVMPSVAATIVPFMHLIGDNSTSRNQQGDAERAHSQKQHKKMSKVPRRWSSRKNRCLQEDAFMHRQRPNNTNNQHEVESSVDAPYSMGALATEQISHELRMTLESIAFIAEHMKVEMADKKIRDDWKYISMVIDRLLLVTFFGITLGGTVAIIFSAPHVFDFVDQRQIIQKLTAASQEATVMQS
ncbi:Acetylcholine receptor subunit beta-type acr-2 [Toxocara canis]|uniref:Acetylcholine receptor subunit beta-type acr-2 n=1 Tax=Toxocara canis TaxID=6265 RepID=A0A0B2UPB1_TOXCA|nr:Acetylcholine receptor subunit beta-type acr-2 [Toxocara canis]